MKFEEKLKLLFEYQKFENNTELNEIISNFFKSKNELTNEQLSFATGGLKISETNNKKTN